MQISNYLNILYLDKIKLSEYLKNVFLELLF